MQFSFKLYPLGDLEPAYKAHFLNDDKRLAALSILVALLATQPFVYNDYLLFGLSPMFYGLFSVRIMQGLIAVAVLYILRRTTSWITFERATLTAMLAHIVMSLIVDASRPSANYGTSPINILTLLGLYLFVPNRLAWQIALALLFTFGELTLATFFKTLSPVTLNGLWITYLTSNFLGAVTALRLENFRRAQFLAYTKEQAARLELERLANTDGLTGISNRRSFLEQAALELGRFRRYRHPLTIILFDLDHFKQINDQHGHAAGDEVLQAVAHMIEHRKRTSDVFGRLGGEEFGLLLPEVAQAEALLVGERLLAQCQALSIASPAGAIRVTFSGGVAQATTSDQTIDHLIQRADRALYHAKHTGRNRLEIAED